MMTRKILDIFKFPRGHTETALWLFVKCNRCGEVLRTRIDLRNDLSQADVEEEEDQTYICRKILVGSRHCFQRIEIECRYDQQHRLLDRKIQGGKFITEQDYHVGMALL
ncbi:MAG: hypothetical protein MUO64_03930 [Anaerolineales bacterium]|nr:hypothetical protein [Anaerolineales bacterium]